MTKHYRPDPLLNSELVKVLPDGSIWVVGEHKVLPDGSMWTAGGHKITKDGSIIQADGSVIVSMEQTARLGGGDAKEGRQQLRLLLADAADRSIFDGPTAKPETVRIAGVSDEPDLLALMISDLKENAERVALIDEESVLTYIQACTHRKGGVAGVIDGPEGRPIAVVMLHPFAWWFSKQHYYMEIMNYVHADHRRSQHAKELLKFQAWWADEMTRQLGYRVYLLCGVLTARRMYAKKLMYRRRFAEVGGAYLYPSPNWKG